MSYHEPGVGWIALIWGPLFAVLGALAEVATGGPVHVVAWILVAVTLAVITIPWVYARRRYLSVEVTPDGLRQGREEIPAEQIAEVLEETPEGARVLGGGFTVPRKYDELPLKLADGSLVLAWARDVEALREAVTRVARAGSAGS